MERPAELADKEVLTEAEAREFEAQEAIRRNRDTNVPEGNVGDYNEFWYDRGRNIDGSKRTSLIVDPPNGRMPALTPEAQKRQDAITAARQGTGFHEPTPGGWVEELGPGGLQVRCLLGFNSGPPMTPGAYNNNVQIVQAPGYIALVNEMVHNTRIVLMDGRPRSGARQWVGESRGRWEGDTLVVETSNFLRETAFVRGSTTGNLRLIERFTRVDADTLEYEFTVEDPTVWTRPWTARFEMSNNNEHLFEYACHEGNYGLPGILAGARQKEKAAADATKAGSK